MSDILIITGLVALFYVLGKAADVIVVNVRHIAERLGIHIFFLGIILGFFTSLPELSIGINALITDTSNISLGNLLGGIIVLFGLILGGSIILNRRIKTDGKAGSILPMFILIFLPIVLGTDGKLSLPEGLLIIVAYFFLVYHLYRQHKDRDIEKRISISPAEFVRKILFVIGGTIFVILISDLIIQLTLMLLTRFNIPQFITGLLFFSLGTNLPEITVTVRSWKRHIKELSISNLMGSALANTLIIGLFAFIRPFEIPTNVSFVVTGLFMFLIFVAFTRFYKTDNALTKYEGMVLVGLYLLFVIVEASAFI